MADPDDTGSRSRANYDGPERRNQEHVGAVNDPRFWVSVTAVLLTIGLALLSLAISKLSSIDTAVQGILVASTRQGEEIRTLKEQVAEHRAANKELRDKLEAAEKRQTDYNFNLSARLKEIEMILKLKSNGGT